MDDTDVFAGYVCVVDLLYLDMYILPSMYVICMHHLFNYYSPLYILSMV